MSDTDRLRHLAQHDQLSGGRESMIVEAFIRDMMLDVVNAADQYAYCLDLVQTQPRAAGMLLSLTARAWLNASRLLNHIEAGEPS